MSERKDYGHHLQYVSPVCRLVVGDFFLYTFIPLPAALIPSDETVYTPLCTLKNFLFMYLQ